MKLNYYNLMKLINYNIVNISLFSEYIMYIIINLYYNILIIVIKMIILDIDYRIRIAAYLNFNL